MAMKQASWRRVVCVLLVASSALLGSCDSSSSGVGFSVGLPTSYGSMELGTATTQWVGSPFW
jgi:predicted small secreted protein